MGSIPLLATTVRPPEPMDPLGQANKLLSYKAALQNQQNQQQEAQQQQQLNAQKLQAGQASLADQKATTDAMREWDGKNMEELPGLVLKKGGSSNAVLGLKETILKQKKSVSDMAKTDSDTLKAQLDNEATKNDFLAQQIDGLKTLVTDPKNPLAPAAAAAQFESVKQKAIDAGHLDPKVAAGIVLDPSKPIGDQLQAMEDNLLGHKKVVEALKAHADITKGEAEVAHNKVMETPASERDFQAYYKNYLSAKGLEANAKNEFAARDEYKQMNRSAVAGAVSTDDAKAIADAIQSGDQPPTLQGLYRNGAAVRAELAKRGVPIARMEEDWKAVNKNLATLNGPQQLRLRQAISSTSDMLPVIEKLYDNWKATGLPSGFKTFNKAALAASKQLPGEAGKAATLLEAQIADFSADLGTVYRGGNSSTDASLAKADQNLKADWNEETFKGALDLAKTNLGIRANSIRTSQPVGVGANSPYVQPITPEAAPAAKSGSGKTLSLAQIQKAAKDHGVSVDEAKKQAEAQGYQVK